MEAPRPQYRRTYIRKWREYRNLTQAQLAERIGISIPQLSRLENGQRQYTQALLERAAEALSTDAASLLMRDPSKDDAIWSIWENLKPEERRQAAAVIDALKKASNH
jgi:transcriptional regulator with XRE-family HTH domain